MPFAPTPCACRGRAASMRRPRAGARSRSRESWFKPGAFLAMRRCSCSTPAAARRTGSSPNMRIAIFDAFSGIAGDMALGALVQVGLDADWLRALPDTLGLSRIEVRIREVVRGEIVCQKVDFDIPPQPHGRHIQEIREIVSKSGAPLEVRERADRAFTALAMVEGEIHGLPPEKVHLHEVGSVDAILDVIGVIWGLEQLNVERVHVGAIALGDGTVKAAHGVLPVPAPATLKLLEGHPVRRGPEGAGELVTPTGAALVRVLSSGYTPDEYTPIRSGFGAGTKDPSD